MTIVTYGEGGYCEDCSPSHDHPLHNILAQTEIEPSPEEQARQSALDKLKKLGLTEAEASALIYNL